MAQRRSRAAPPVPGRRKTPSAIGMCCRRRRSLLRGFGVRSTRSVAASCPIMVVVNIGFRGACRIRVKYLGGLWGGGGLLDSCRTQVIPTSHRPRNPEAPTSFILSADVFPADFSATSGPGSLVELRDHPPPWRRLRAMQSGLAPLALWGLAAAGVTSGEAQDLTAAWRRTVGQVLHIHRQPDDASSEKGRLERRMDIRGARLAMRCLRSWRDENPADSVPLIEQVLVAKWSDATQSPETCVCKRERESERERA